MTEPLVITFDVDCVLDRAFMLWTSSINTWWPHDHTVSGARDTTVVLQGGLGGRIFERTAEGVEHDWGQITHWEPPHRLGYRWHLGRDADQATQVEIRFAAHDQSKTRIEIEHHGWEQLGTEHERVRQQNTAGWQAVLVHYVAAIQNGVK